MNKRKFLPTFRLIGSYLIKCILISLIAVLFPCNPGNAALHEVNVETIEQAQTQQVISEHKVETILAEAYLLFKEGTADSQKQAQDKWNSLLSGLRTKGDRFLEAITLHEIGLVHKEAGDYWTALSFLKQSQLISRATHDKLADLVTGIQISTAYKNLIAQNDPKAKTEYIKHIMQELDRADKLRGNTIPSLNDDIELDNMVWLDSTNGWNQSDK